MWKKTPFTKKAKCKLPIIQAPMALATTPELVAAVSNEGAIGSYGAALDTPEEIRKNIHKIRELTDQPFNVNLFTPLNPSRDEKKIHAMNQILQGYRDELGVEAPTIPKKIPSKFDEKMQVILEEKPAIFSFTFGSLDLNYTDRLREEGILICGSATTVEEGIYLEKNGVDMITAQGFEAGGHRATFLHPIKDALIGNFALIPQLTDHASVPVIAAGAIMDARGMLAALILGASAVQMGTAFLTTHESPISREYKNAILKASSSSTTLTRSFTGKSARAIRNRFVDEMDSFEELTCDFPIQGRLTAPIRKKASEKKKEDLLSLWCGQAPNLSQDISTSHLIINLVINMDDLVKILP